MAGREQVNAAGEVGVGRVERAGLVNSGGVGDRPVQRLGVEFLVGAVALGDQEFVAGEGVLGELGCRVAQVESVPTPDRHRLG